MLLLEVEVRQVEACGGLRAGLLLVLRRSRRRRALRSMRLLARGVWLLTAARGRVLPVLRRCRWRRI